MTTWVLLRGLARESRHWGDFPRCLQAELPRGERVVAVDLPGNGTLHSAASPTRVRAMVEACRGQLAAQCARPPYAVIALSMGAMVALDWSHAYPGELQACVLINTSFGGSSPFWRRLRPSSYGPLLKLLLPALSQLARERLVLALTSADAGRHAHLPPRWARFASQRPVSRANVLRQLAAAGLYRPPAVPPPVPVMLLASANDRLVSPRCSHAYASRWALPLQVHPASGHDLPLDDPAWVIGQSLAWWRALKA